MNNDVRHLFSAPHTCYTGKLFPEKANTTLSQNCGEWTVDRHKSPGIRPVGVGTPGLNLQPRAEAVLDSGLRETSRKGPF